MRLLKFLKNVKANNIDLSSNPYAQKYSIKDIGLDNVIYLLYCDYSDAFRWIKDARKPDVYFSKFDSAIQILEVLNSYEDLYEFKSPTPKKQIKELNKSYEAYTKAFIVNYWNSTLTSASKLKTETGKQRRIQAFFDNMDIYSERLTSSLTDFINNLKKQQSNRSYFDSYYSSK